MAYHEVNRSFETKSGPASSGRSRGRNAVRPRRAVSSYREEPVKEEKPEKPERPARSERSERRERLTRTERPTRSVRREPLSPEDIKLAEMNAKATELEAKAREEAIARARAEAKAQAEAKAKADAEARAKAAAEEQARKEAEERARIEAEVRAQIEAENKAKAEAEAAAKAKAEEEAKAAEEARMKAEAEDALRLEMAAEGVEAEAVETAKEAAELEAESEGELKEETEPAASVENEADEAKEEPVTAEMPVKKEKGGKFIKAALIILGIELIALYVGGFVFFKSHFLPHTFINGSDVSLMSSKQAEDVLNGAAAVEYYSLNAPDGSNLVLDLSDADIKRNYNTGLKELASAQNAAMWPMEFSGIKEMELLGDEVSYNADVVAQSIAPILEIGSDAQNACLAASPDKHGYVVVKEHAGTKLDPDAFMAVLDEHIRKSSREIDLASANCYVQPTVTFETEELYTEATRLSALDRFDAAVNIGAGDALILKGEKLSDLLASSNAAAELANELGDMMDTVSENGEKPYYTFDGKRVVIKTGYGWKMNREETAESIQHMLDAVADNVEVQLAKQNAPEVVDELPEGYYLVENKDGHYTTDSGILGDMSSGMKLTEWDEKYGCNATVVWEQEAASHRGRDIGENYAEVDINAQTVRIIQGGDLVLETPCVTGTERKGRLTPDGIFSVFLKQTHRVLTGYNPDGTVSYRSPVTYWMPFNKNIGFHDATWRGAFGGKIYLSSGSHGCVNLPKVMAEKVYSIIQKNWTVVVYRTPDAV